MKGMESGIQRQKLEQKGKREKKEAPPLEEMRILSALKIKDRRPIKGAITKGEPMHYIGVDCHKRKSFLTAVDIQGEVKGRWEIPNEGRELDRILKRLGGECEAVLEASSVWPVMYDLLDERVKKVMLAHPLKVRAIAEAKIKNDRIDSGVLAQLLRADLIPEAYAPSKETRYKKNVLRYRMSLVRVQTSVKNRIHALLMRNHVSGEEQDAIADLFGTKGRAYLAGLTLGGSDREILCGYLELLDELEKRIAGANRLIVKAIGDDRLTKLLRGMPGIGAVLAPVIRYEVDRIGRFSRCGKFLCYCALVPGLYATGNMSRTTGILKQGNKYLKYAFIEAVTPAVRSSIALRAYYHRVREREGTHAARVAVARKLAKIAYHIMKDEKPYCEELIRRTA